MPECDPLLDRARQVWAALAGVPVTFPGVGAATVVTSPQSRICPPGWVGMVALGGAVLATAPAGPERARVAPVLASPADAGLLALDPEALAARLPVAELLGPASLAYLAESDLRTVGDLTPVLELPAQHPEVAALLGTVPGTEAEESGLDAITSPAFVLGQRGLVAAAAGYRRWPGEVAHLCVLSAPAQRGNGLATRVAGAATAHALRHGLLPQWRARLPASARVARRLGFRELGRQLSLRLTPSAPADG
ncbi:GNAT family N-acetyltransferase [Natronosporangium hydrolyticum]|uniref:GNAT family N-acetyltransferase n=1 Tax=Natronosporangium hydrolyticum TaxID=2811111 RepID=A0A895YHE6_9ACTN|nr:GNAT family N-acetyltransferase [Natronosporangium hydrolyticum]QSB13946.1 GNAT family N-acetyltransferase [Natronosporangium hydrolyticum]